MCVPSERVRDGLKCRRPRAPAQTMRSPHQREDGSTHPHAVRCDGWECKGDLRGGDKLRDSLTNFTPFGGTSLAN